MKIHDLANKQFESIDEITTDIAESIIEIDEVVKEKEKLEKEKENNDQKSGDNFFKICFHKLIIQKNCCLCLIIW